MSRAGRRRVDRLAGSSVGALSVVLRCLVRLVAQRRACSLPFLSFTFMIRFDHRRRCFTTSNSEVVTMYSSRAGRIVAISFCAAFDAIRRRRMRARKSWGSCRAASFLGLDLLEEGHERVRVVAGLVHVLQAEIIGFAFVRRARISGTTSESRSSCPGRAVAGPAARTEHDQRNVANCMMSGPWWRSWCRGARRRARFHAPSRRRVRLLHRRAESGRY